MVNRVLVGGLAAAAAGAAMLAISSAPASAFTLASPSLESPVAGADVDKVWWDRWGHWRPGPGWRRHHHHRRCWVGRWGYWHCRYW
jgi:hypothetical protein